VSVVILPTPLVSTAWLAEHLGWPGLLPLDASWYLPASGRDPHAEYRRAHIPGALFWDLDALSRDDTDLPHMMPAPQRLAAALGRMGIGNDSAVVCYDGSGTNFSAARAWWMLRAIGHARASVLDGGLSKWRAEGRPLTDREPPLGAVTYTPAPRDDAFVGLERVHRAMEKGGSQLVDARSAGRFRGTEPEPRPGVRSGHIPGALNLPHAELTAPDGTLLPAGALAERYRAAGIDLTRPVIASCGSGVSACALVLGLEALGHKEHTVYDGSWTEWGGRDDTPIGR